MLVAIFYKKRNVDEGKYTGSFYCKINGQLSDNNHCNTLDVSVLLSNKTDSSMLANGYTLKPLKIKGDSIFGTIPTKTGDYYVAPNISARILKKWGELQ